MFRRCICLFPFLLQHSLCRMGQVAVSQGHQERVCRLFRIKLIRLQIGGRNIKEHLIGARNKRVPAQLPFLVLFLGFRTEESLPGPFKQSGQVNILPGKIRHIQPFPHIPGGHCLHGMLLQQVQACFPLPLSCMGHRHSQYNALIISLASGCNGSTAQAAWPKISLLKPLHSLQIALSICQNLVILVGFLGRHDSHIIGVNLNIGRLRISCQRLFQPLLILRHPRFPTNTQGVPIGGSSQDIPFHTVLLKLIHNPPHISERLFRCVRRLHCLHQIQEIIRMLRKLLLNKRHVALSLFSGRQHAVINISVMPENGFSQICIPA